MAWSLFCEYRCHWPWLGTGLCLRWSPLVLEVGAVGRGAVLRVTLADSCLNVGRSETQSTKLNQHGTLPCIIVNNYIYIKILHSCNFIAYVITVSIIVEFLDFSIYLNDYILSDILYFIRFVCTVFILSVSIHWSAALSKLSGFHGWRQRPATMLEAARTYASPFCWRVSAVCCRLGLTRVHTGATGGRNNGSRTKRTKTTTTTKTKKLFAPTLFGDTWTRQATPSTINNPREYQIFQIRESHSKNIALPVLFCHVKNQWLGMAYCQVLANLCTLLVGKETATLPERSQSPEPVREEGPLRDCERTPKLRSFFLKQTFYLPSTEKGLRSFLCLNMFCV